VVAAPRGRAALARAGTCQPPCRWHGWRRRALAPPPRSWFDPGNGRRVGADPASRGGDRPSLRDPPPDRARRHGRGLRRGPAAPGRRGRAQAPAAQPGHRGQPPALRDRGPGRGPHPPPQRRAVVRLRGRRHDRAVPGDGAPRGADLGGDPRRRPAAPGPGPRAVHRDLRRGRGRSPPRHRPPRPQAGQRDRHHRRRRPSARQGPRLRPGRGSAHRRSRHHHTGHDDRHGRVHGARADRRAVGLAGQRRLRPRRGAVRAGHRGAAVRRRVAARDPDGAVGRSLRRSAGPGPRAARPGGRGDHRRPAARPRRSPGQPRAPGPARPRRRRAGAGRAAGRDPRGPAAPGPRPR
jgi:hypothetical protein